MCRIGVVERVVDVLIDAPPAAGEEEPQLVLHDRPAETAAEVAIDLHRPGTHQSARDQFRRAVIADPSAGLESEIQRSLENVPAFLGNHVEANACPGGLRADGTRLK